MILENTLTEKAKNELNKIKEIAKTVDRKNFVYGTNEYTYSFRIFWRINTFCRDIYNGKITLKEADEDQSNLLVEIMDFRKRNQDQRIQVKNKRRKLFLKTCMHFLRLQKKYLMILKANISNQNWKYRFFRQGLSSHHSNHKMLSPKYMIQRIPIALAQVKSANTYENLVNEIRRII